MDSLTQLVLGAAVGESVLGKKVGNKAVLWGAIAGTIPDLDVFVAGFFDVVTELSIHRGFSHSIVFSLLGAPLLALLIHQLYKKKNASWQEWTQLCFLCLITHPILDCFTTWGTQLFWPLPHRVAFHSIFVIDPLYTIPLFFSVLVLLFYKKNSSIRRKLNRMGLLLSSLYLFSSLLNKYLIIHIFEKDLDSQKIEYHDFQTRPAPFTTLMWSANVETDKEFLLGYYSYFDTSDRIDYTVIPKNHELLYPYRNQENIEKLLAITEGYYTVSNKEGNLIVNDLRFGMTEGWNAKGNFVFSYKILPTTNGDVLIEKVENDLQAADQILNSWWTRLKGN